MICLIFCIILYIPKAAKFSFIILFFQDFNKFQWICADHRLIVIVNREKCRIMKNYEQQKDVWCHSPFPVINFKSPFNNPNCRLEPPNPPDISSSSLIFLGLWHLLLTTIYTSQFEYVMIIYVQLTA